MDYATTFSEIGHCPDFEVRKDYRALYVLDNLLYVSRGLSVYESDDYGKHFKKIGHYPTNTIKRAFTCFRILAQTMRIGFHSLLPMPDGSMLGVIRGAIVHKLKNETSFHKVFAIARGSRPLNLCYSPSGTIYFGEYFKNPKRDEVYIYASSDGLNWTVAYAFKKKEIRHIHGIYVDVYRQGLWILTGDHGNEAGLWFTKDDFKTLEAITRGQQTARAVAIIPCASGLIVPMDSPYSVNYIQHFDPASGRFEKLQKLPGSAFHAAKAQDVMLVSTVVEPSKINLNIHPTVYASIDGYKWHCIAHFKRSFSLFRDINRFRYINRHLQFPNVILPAGRNMSPYVYATGIALQKLDGQLIKWPLNYIKQFLQRLDG